MSDADKMREKQRIAQLKKEGKWPEVVEQKKEFDDSFLKQFDNINVEDDAPTDAKYEEEKLAEEEDAAAAFKEAESAKQNITTNEPAQNQTKQSKKDKKQAK